LNVTSFVKKKLKFQKKITKNVKNISNKIKFVSLLLIKNYNLFVMKNLFITVAGLLLFASCGPNAEEMAAKAQADSIRIADSIAVVEAEAAAVAAAEQAKADSIAMAEAEKAKADSIAAAAAAPKKGKK
jgi:hypothetical protein